MLRLLHVGLGPVGIRVVRDLHERGLGRIVAAVDHDPALRGKTLADVVPGIDADVPVVGHVSEVGDLGGVRAALVTSSSDLELCMDTFRPLLKAGITVVSSCEELSWPWLRHPVRAQELHETCVRHGGRLLGAGVNPGFLMDALPVALTTVCKSVHGLRAERIQDATDRRLPFLRKIGATLEVEEFRRRIAAGTLRHVGLGESLHFVAHYLGLELERWDETIEPVLAVTELECGLGKIPEGAARGVEQIASGWLGGEKRLELVFRATIGEKHPKDRIVIDGEPPVTFEIPGGVPGDVATSAICMNALRPLLAAPPGLHTMGTIALQGCTVPDDFAPPDRSPSAPPDPPPGPSAVV